VRIRFGTSHGTRQQLALPSATSAPPSPCPHPDSGAVFIVVGLVDRARDDCGLLFGSVG
jgi:hypothetical protein